MSQENVEIVRVIFDAVNHRDVERALDNAHEDFEMDWSNSIGPAKGVYRGRAVVAKLWASFIEAWEWMRWESEEIIDVDATRVIVVNRNRMRGRGSGVEVEATGVQVWTLRDGKAQTVKIYQSKDEALEAVGLSEHDAHADSS